MRARRPDALILGTSRAGWGYSVQGAPWRNYVSYNLSLSSAHMYEVRRYLQHAAAFAKPRLILLALDPIMFHTSGHHGPDFREDRLAVSASGEPTRFPVIDLLQIALSVDLYWENWSALSQRGQAELTAAGNVDVPTMMAHSYSARVSAPTLFERRLPETAEQYASAAYGDFDAAYRENLLELRRTLEAGAAAGARMVVVINPIHVTLMDLLARRGLLRNQFRWTYDVVDVISGFERQTGRTVPVWNFCTVNPWTTRPLTDRPLIAAAPDLLFMDPGHFSQALGDRVQARAFGLPSDAADLGDRLTSVTMHAHIAEELAKLERWRAANPDVDQWLRRLAASPRD